MECSCNNNNNAKFALETPTLDTCPTVVHENVCVQGTVAITPMITTGEIKSFCVGKPVIGRCNGELQRFCSFAVSQNICVQVPLVFSAEATVTPNGIVCGTPGTGPCSNGSVCTHTIGFYRNHPEVTNSLITAAGGFITLGTGSGLSFVVTTANANDVLSLNTPTPPAPDSPPFAGQYQILYAQLLAAQLNSLSIISQGVEVCNFAITAIAAANTFLDTSPDDGKAGAPEVQEPLALFNEGNALGCPQHCNDDN